MEKQGEGGGRAAGPKGGRRKEISENRRAVGDTHIGRKTMEKINWVEVLDKSGTEKKKKREKSGLSSGRRTSGDA